MGKKELLAPAGNMEALKQAVHHGADAIYVGGKRFGARAFAPNFTDEELKEAAAYCHLYGVKLYVTVNTMIYERELKHALTYVKFLDEIHVDAVIVADLGLMSLIHEEVPRMEIHASTQTHTFSLAQIHFLKELGVTRVVVDRELSLHEIEKLAGVIELEVFIHGALCVSYSGQCLMSALEKGRSGNRGCCAQLCRLLYTVYSGQEEYKVDGNYVLSTKELNTSAHIKELMDSSVTSFKIEGRMKSPEYVGFITAYYRKLMDQYQAKQDCQITPQEKKNLALLFNRDFTDGYLFQEQSIMNMRSSNHQGIKIGKVLVVTKEKIKILLQDDLFQEDGIRFVHAQKGMMVNFLYDEHGKYIHHGKAQDVVFVDNKVGLTELDVVHKTIDKQLMDGLKEYPFKKIAIQMKAVVTKHDLVLSVSDGTHLVEQSFAICEEAKNHPITKEILETQLKKLGNTPFLLTDLQIDLEEGVFIVLSKLNEARRCCIQALIEQRQEGKIENVRKAE